MGEEAATKQLQELVSYIDINLPAETKYFTSQRASGKSVDEEMVSLAPEQFGRPKAPAGTWASCIRIIDPVEVSIICTLSLCPFAITVNIAGSDGQRRSLG